MPNGISCACFAIRNHKAAETTNNAFREGIAAVQTVRTVDAASKMNFVQKSALKPALPILSKVTAVLRKFLYPLIIGSGVYTTIKSDDKVKTGISQATGIGTMYAVEKVVAKGLKHIDEKVSNMKGAKHQKAIKAGWYVLKGLTYMSSSIMGYKLGSTLSEKTVDKVRESINSKDKIDSVDKQQKKDVFSEFA